MTRIPVFDDTGHVIRVAAQPCPYCGILYQWGTAHPERCPKRPAGLR